MTLSPDLHRPVMLREMLAAIAPADGEVYVDGTFGAGGYTQAILDAADCRVIAFDRDPEARARYDALPASVRDRCTFIDAPFSSLHSALSAQGITSINGVVLDLGVSSPQLDDAARGFSFRGDGPLDMRMDPRTGANAADLVNTLPERELADILFQYGEEKKSRAIARAIVDARRTQPITTTAQLANLIRRVIKASPRDTIDPATRSFQALRIAVNDELGELRAALQSALQCLAPGGRLVVVTFHSLEDRIVKQFFTTHGGRAPNTSRHLPTIGAATAPALLDLPTIKPIAPSDDEVAVNPRARSAHLRRAIRTDIAITAHNPQGATA